jgi:hypothetical protein
VTEDMISSLPHPRGLQKPAQAHYLANLSEPIVTPAALC